LGVLGKEMAHPFSVWTETRAQFLQFHLLLNNN
jgi:hypothetical protein